MEHEAVTSAVPVAGTPTRPAFAWWPAAVVLVLVFGYRFLSFQDFPNDHYVYVARAQQVVFGGWPGRDFVDPGFFLMYLVSAAGQVLLGHNLLGEALLVFGGFSVAAALTYLLAREATGSTVAAVLCVLLQALAYPRSYSYPKLPLHALALLLAWSYVTGPTRMKRLCLAAVIAIAFLFRPDHGVAIGLVALGAVLGTSGIPIAIRLRHLAEAALGTIVLLAPWLVFMEVSAGGLVPYFRSALGFTGRKIDAGAMEWPGFPLGAGASGGLALDHEALLYYFFVIVPAISVGVLWWRRRSAAPMPDATVRLALVVLLAVFANATLLRDPLRNRLADVAVPQGVLAAWLLTLAWRAFRGWAVWSRAAVRVAIVGMVVIVTVAVGRLGGAAERLGDIPIHPGLVAKRAALIIWALGNVDESAGMAKPSPLPPLVRYLRACTEAEDKVMYIGYAPETYFFARRAFAGGHAVIEGGSYASATEQAVTLARLRRERVPIIAMRDESAADLRGTFSLIAAHLDAQYVRIGTIERPGGEHDGIFAERQLKASGSYSPLGLPCFARR